jgi:tRNA (cmo5U34)-methyltransferase
MTIDRYATVGAQLAWLREADFVNAGEIFRSWRFAVYAGWKTPGPRGTSSFAMKEPNP